MKRIMLFVAVMALVATACGGSADADDGVASLDGTVQLDGAVDTTVSAMSEEEALLAFTACLRDAGVDIDDPTVDSEGNLRIARPNTGAGAAGGDSNNFDRDVFRAAREQCGELLDGVALGFRDTDRTEIEDQLLEFAACVRDNGYQIDDPDFSGIPGQGGGGGPFGGIDREDPAFVAAAEACQDTLPGFARGGGPGGGRGGGQDN
ncbi:MAG: hypothetical protein GY720_07275 [bacterium]|nr:hypothetical protein [bacterium]